MSTVQEILTAMDKLTPDELRVLKIGVDSRLNEDDDPALMAAIQEAIAHADAHPGEGKSIEDVRALIPRFAQIFSS